MLVGSAVRRVAIVGGLRIPFARAYGAYATASNQDMLTAALRAVVERFKLQGERLGDVAAGAVLKHSRDYNLVRESVLSSGLDAHTPGLDMQRACGTSLEAAIDIGNKIALGQIEAGIAGGTDSISDAPVVYPRSYQRLLLASYRGRNAWERVSPWFGLRPRHFKPVLPAVVEPRTGLSMGQSTEIMAKRWRVGRAAHRWGERGAAGDAGVGRGARAAGAGLPALRQGMGGRLRRRQGGVADGAHLRRTRDAARCGPDTEGFRLLRDSRGVRGAGVVHAESMAVTGVLPRCAGIARAARQHRPGQAQRKGWERGHRAPVRRHRRACPGHARQDPRGRYQREARSDLGVRRRRDGRDGHRGALSWRTRSWSCSAAARAWGRASADSRARWAPHRRWRSRRRCWSARWRMRAPGRARSSLHRRIRPRRAGQKACSSGRRRYNPSRAATWASA